MLFDLLLFRYIENHKSSEKKIHTNLFRIFALKLPFKLEYDEIYSNPDYEKCSLICSLYWEDCHFFVFLLESMFTIESNELWKWQWELHIFKILAALEFNYLIIFQYNTKIDKILLLRILEKTIIYVVLLQNIIIRTHLVFYNLIITFYILTSRSGFFETESLFLKKKYQYT